MARRKTTTSNTQHTANEIRNWASQPQNSVAFFSNQELATILRDVTKSSTTTVNAVNKETLKGYIENVTNNEKNLRNTAKYLYYRSNILYRLINFYANMWDLNCRKVIPPYDLSKKPDTKKTLKSFNDTLDVLEKMNLQGNLTEMFLNVYLLDVCYAFAYYDDTGMFFYVLDPDECIIDSRYTTSDFGFSIDMSKWRSNQRQTIIEYLGSPLKEMYEEYQKTGIKYVHCPDDYACCFKFRTDDWQTVVPPFVSLFLQLAGLEDLIDIQAAADALSIYKLVYLPMKTKSSTSNINDFEIDPSLSHTYFKKLLDNALPDGVAGAMVPGDELKVIDFSKTVDSDTNSVEQSSNQILQTAGGGAVINANKITSSAAFKAWLKSETNFALSTLLPQVDGFANRFLSYKVSNPSKVKHFEVSVYTKEEFAESLLKSCQYSFANRLAYNTCLGMSEKDTLALAFLENEVLDLPNLMSHPLSSSFTQSGTDPDDVGAPTKDDDEITESGDRMRNK